MDFKDELKQLGDRVTKLKEHVGTEEATKTSFVLPFIAMLGYDVYNPLEVVPEFVADIGIKQGEKVDYAVLKDSLPIILIECKWHGVNLDVHNSQLFRYFHTSKAKFGILTNGIEYRFYSDLLEVNKMDEKPFFTINITEIKDGQIDELKKFHKSYFNLESIANTANELKYMAELTQHLKSELESPSQEFVKFFAKQVYPSMITSKVLDQFTQLMKQVITQHTAELINNRLKIALQKEEEIAQQTKAVVDAQSTTDVKGIETTEEELEAYYIVKSILHTTISPERIHYKDSQSYFVVLLDHNVRKYVCRLYLDGTKKYIGLFDSEKHETRHEIQSINDIYSFNTQLLATSLQLIAGKHE